MERFDGADRAFCVREFYRNDNSATIARRKFRQHHNLRNFNDTPSVQTIKKWVTKFEESGSTLDKQRSGRPRTSRTEQNIDVVKQSIHENPTQSTRKRSSALNIPRTSIQRILKKDLLLHPYKIENKNKKDEKSNPTYDSTSPSSTEDPGPSTSKPGASKSKPGPSKSKASIKQDVLDVEFEPVDVEIKLEPQDDVEMTSPDVPIQKTVLGKVKKESPVSATPKKRARLDTTRRDFHAPSVTSELIIKDDPSTFEAILQPSIICQDTPLLIPVKQEIPDQSDVSISLANVIEATVSAGIKREINEERSTNDPLALSDEHAATVFGQVKEEYIETPEDTTSSDIGEKIIFITVYEILEKLIQEKLISTSEKNILMTYSLNADHLKRSQRPGIVARVKAFAKDLYIFSYKAYEFVFTRYQTCLPPPSKMKEWLVRGRGGPGFTRDSLEAIHKKVAGAFPTFVCLVLKDVQVVTSLTRGPMAKNENKDADGDALIMSAVALNANWKLPIGYFLTENVKASARANLVQDALSLLEATGVEPIAVSCEHNPDTLIMCKHLNCSLGKDLKTSFLSKSGKCIFLFPNPCGVLEKIAMDNYEEFYEDESGRLVALTQIPLLLESCCKVKVAPTTTPLQQLSKALASDLCKIDYLKNILSSEHKEGEGTALFLKNINIVLNVLTSRKQEMGTIDPIANSSILKLQEAGRYFKGIRLSGSNEPLWESSGGAGILGLFALIDSAIMMLMTYSSHVPIQFGKFVCNPTYFLANLTPQGLNRKKTTAYSFDKCYRVLLPPPEQKHFPIENLSVLICSSGVERINLTTSVPNGLDMWHVEDDLWRVMEYQGDEFRDSLTSYIARFVTYYLVSRLRCDVCISTIHAKSGKGLEYPPAPLPEALTKTSLDKVVSRKLSEPSADVMEICKKAEAAVATAIKLSDFKQLNPKFSLLYLTTKVMKKYVNMPLFESIRHHQFDTDQTCNHVVELCKAVVQVYLETRIKHYQLKFKQKQCVKKTYKSKRK